MIKGLSRRIDVSHLSRYNGIALVISTTLFFVTIWRPAYDPSYVLAATGGVALLVSYFITAASYYRQLFTAEPQKISMLFEKKKRSKITVSPYILDKRKINIFVEFMDFLISPNYVISSVTLDGAALRLVSSSDAKYEVNRAVSTASKFIIELEERDTEVTSRFLQFCLFYNKNQKSPILKFKECHRID